MSRQYLTPFWKTIHRVETKVSNKKVSSASDGGAASRTFTSSMVSHADGKSGAAEFSKGRESTVTFSEKFAAFLLPAASAHGAKSKFRLASRYGWIPSASSE